MPHIHAEANQHDLTVAAYVVRTDTPEPRVLLHVHKKLGMLLPVGGHVELLETPWQAIAHELEEEAGYELKKLQILQPKSRIKNLSKTVHHPNPVSMNTHSIPGNHFHTEIEYAFVAKTKPELELGVGESLDLRWMSQSELNDLEAAEVFDNTKEVYNFILNEALTDWSSVKTDDFLLEFPEEYRYDL